MIAPSLERRPLTSLFVLAMAMAFATRAWQFGNPVVQVDEQLYLLIGDRILKGSLLYVDVWDRKPVGIFLLNAAIRLLGGDGIVEYQVIATLFAGATAFLIGAMALRFAGLRGAALAGAAYLAWLVIFDGSGGQTPVFYNLPMAAAGALVLLGTEPGAGARKLIGYGLAAMGLVGIALQIKYSAVFEGLFFGLVLLWRAWQTMGVFRTLMAGIAWIALALLPTGAALIWYIAIGHADAFVYTNFVSIFQRGGWPAGTLFGRLFTLTSKSLPLLICAWVEWGSVRAAAQDDPALHARRFALGWLASAILGLLLFGTYFVHYFLPVLVPLTLCCARVLGRPTAWLALKFDGSERRVPVAAILALVAAVMATNTSLKRLKHRGRPAQISAFATVISRNLEGCLFVFDGDPILYYLTNACIPTRLAFPNHFNDAVEKGSVGLDPTEETRRIFTKAPPDIVVGGERPEPGYNAATLALANQFLARDYHEIARQKIGSRVRIAYKRNGTAHQPTKG